MRSLVYDVICSVSLIRISQAGQVAFAKIAKRNSKLRNISNYTEWPYKSLY